MTTLTTDQISYELAQHATAHILHAEALEGNLRQRAYMLSIRHSLAGWVLSEAADEQLMQIWEQHRPSVERN